MRRILFSIAVFLFSLASVMGQMIPITLPADGNWPTIVGDSIMIIGPRQNELTEEQRYFNPVYLMTYPGKEYLKAQMIRAGACDCDPTKPNRRIGVFSVAPDKQVSFSQGNLQCLPAINLWKFANTQYEYLGNANKYIRPTFRNWVDLFGWSANNTTAPFGVSTSTNVADYAGDFVDWGTNTICGDAPNTWRTLSLDEWDYLFKKRTNAAQLYSKGSIEGTRGMIVLPDNWALPEGVQFTVDTANLTMDLDLNAYSYAEWQKMEGAGAVFLCVTGRRDGNVVGYLQEYGCYWSNTVTNNKARHLYFNYDTELFLPSHSGEKHLYARSVRLVHDTIVPKVEPEYVDLGLSVKWATFNVGATSPEDYGDYFAWGETETKETYSWATYKWGTSSSNLTKYNTTDGKTTLEPADDAAQVHWGGKWRMPTKAECQELKDKCDWEWTTSNNINGYRVTGPNGHSIFLPTGGVRIGNASYAIGEYGYLWSSSLLMNNISEAHSAVFTQSSTSCDSDNRYRGRKIRPVYDDRPPKRIGVFSVAADKQVSFSQGNLQYVQSTDTWQFAREQYELIGEDYTTLGIWDLFGWSGKDNNAPFGVSESANVVDYRGEFVDWGKNRIGNDAPATWRTLSRDEWQYLIEIRPKADELYGVAMVAGVQGMILLPDDWVCPEGIIFNHGCHAKDNVENFAKHQTFSQEQWSIMEEAGAIFLPAAGIIYPPSKTITSVAGGAHYYSSDQKDADNAIFFGFRSSYYTINSSANRIRRSVRLVHDTIVPKVEPDPCLIVKVNDTLSINMMCVEGGTFMMGAMEGDKQAHANEKPAHQVTLTYDYYIGQTEVTQALWKAVMGNNPSTMIGDNLPVNNVLWEEADAFVKRLSQMTGYTFHLPTEAEWEFAARGGKKSKGYLYAGSDDVNEVAWYADNSGGTTHAVGTKKPNELGIYDMSGNVWEWCSDWLAPYSAEAQVNPIGPATGEYHVYRGGGWAYGRGYTRSSHRRITTQGYVKTALGLRVAIREKIEPEAVDLGLSVKWANFNVGAFHPTHCGDYFAWGETEPKETYSWATYKWCDGTDANITKYNTADGKTILEPADDAAQVQWGGKWRMPTKEELQELFTRCTWKVETQNGINGYNVIGPNGNSIFVPMAGWYNEDLFGEGVQGNSTYYWTSTLSPSKEIYAYDLVFNDVSGCNDGISANTRRCGFPIRPVYDDRPTLTVIPTPEDAKVTFLCKGYQAVGHSITVDKGKDVLYQVTNVDAGYLSQGDSIYNLTKDSVLYVTLRPFSDGNWVVVDNSELTKYENYYISRNGGSFAGPYSNWDYYVLPVMAGETYRVRAVAGQLAPVWFAASTAPDLATKTRPKKVSCSDNKGVVAYVADEVTIPESAKYLIINNGRDWAITVERKVPDHAL